MEVGLVTNNKPGNPYYNELPGLLLFLFACSYLTFFSMYREFRMRRVPI